MSRLQTRIAILIGSVLILFSVGLADASGPVGSAFTYQGRLTDGGNPANGTYDFQFKLFDDPAAGSQIGSTLTKDNVNVAGGLFSVDLDFSINAFNTDARFLDVAVRAGSSTGAYTPLAPRQRLNPTPYALGLPALRIVQNAGAPNLIGGFRGNHLGSNVNGSIIAGGGSSASPNFIEGNNSFIGGGTGNQDIGNGDSVIGGGAGNTISGHEGTIAGGGANTIGGDHNTIGGGINNVVGGDEAVVGGGNGNHADGNTSTVAGGKLNSATGTWSFIGGGLSNSSTFTETVIGGGFSNIASGLYATVGGGNSNQATGDGAVVSGGGSNHATGIAATIPGGGSNVASGQFSFAAGNKAQALHNGAFVWSDAAGPVFASTDDNQYLIRAVNGVGIGTNTPTAALHVVKNINSTSTPATNVVTIENNNTFNGGDVLALKTDFTGNPDSGSNYITFFKGGTDTSLGSIEGNGAGGVAFDGPGNDYAEWLPLADVRETIQPGDIVAVNAGRVTKDTRIGTQWMVVSSSPIVTGNDPGELERPHHALIAFIGQVQIRTRGVVHAGDFIVPSGSNDGTGVAISADALSPDQTSRVVGQAWDSSTDTGIKTIRAVVGLARFDPNIGRFAEQEQAQAARIAQLENRLTAIEQAGLSGDTGLATLMRNPMLLGAVLVLGIVIGGALQRVRR